MKKKKLIFGIPKGSFQEYTLKIFQQAGFDIEVSKRKYSLNIDDPEIAGYLLRPQEIPGYVAKGKLDAGISGDDWIESTKTKEKIVEVLDLKYAKTGIQRKVRWVLAVPQNSPIKSVQELNGKTVSTEAFNLAKQYFAKHKIKAKLEFSWGATEAKAPRFVDAIIDVTETGSSIRANNLKIIDTVFESSTKLIASVSAWKNPWKQEKIKDIALVLDGAVKGDVAVNISFHIPKKKLADVIKVVPSFKHPTIRKIVRSAWFDVMISCNKNDSRNLIPTLKRLGAESIIEFPIEKLVP